MKQFLACERGATAIEYALIATLISVACILGLTAVGGKQKNMYETKIAAPINAAI